MAEKRAPPSLARLLLNEWDTPDEEARMAKLETIFCVLTCGLMNALLLAVVFGSAAPLDRGQALHNSQLAAVASSRAA